MDVYAVIEDGQGAHEPDAVLSIWETKYEAEGECRRLTMQHESMHGPSRSPLYQVLTIPLGVSSDERLN